MQELVDENQTLILDQQMQHSGKQSDQTKRFELHFGQIYLSKPTMTEGDGTVSPMFPNEARLRSLTYVPYPDPSTPHHSPGTPLLSTLTSRNES